MKITVRNTELECNLLDYDTASAYEQAAKDMQNISATVAAAESLSEKIKLGCTAIFDAIDGIFGDGTSDKLFGGKYQLDEATLAWLEIVRQIGEKTAEEKKKADALLTNNA